MYTATPSGISTGWASSATISPRLRLSAARPKRSRALPLAAIQPDWRPYFPAPVAFDPTRRHLRTLDPVWPQQRYCRPAEWEILRRLDGETTVAGLAATLAADGIPIDPPPLLALLRQAHIDGLLLFRG